MNLSSLHEAVRRIVNAEAPAKPASNISSVERAALRSLQGRLSLANGSVAQLSPVQAEAWWI